MSSNLGNYLAILKLLATHDPVINLCVGGLLMYVRILEKDSLSSPFFHV